MFLALLSFGCAPVVPARAPGERAPLTSTCGSLDPTSCLLPWPSNSFTVADPASATGLRLAVAPEALPIEDRVDYLNVSDGFSRVTGVAFAIDGPLDIAALSWAPAASLEVDAPLQVLVAQPDAPDYGRRVAFRAEAREVPRVGTERHLVIGRPAEVLAPASDHVAVLLDGVGNPGPAPRSVRVALGLDEPRNADEAALVAYHAPTRELLAHADIDPERVLRVTDFTTRSREDTTRRARAMIEAIDGGIDGVGIEVDSVLTTVVPEIAFIVRGRLTGAPSFLDAQGRLVLDGDGLPAQTGTGSIEFRLVVPAGEGDYRVVLYGHGTGGNVSDASFDRELAGQGIAKLAIRYDGWTDQDFVQTLLGFSTFLDGSARSTAGLLQALAGGTALLTSLDGVLGDLITADTLDGQPNPAAGRRPDTSDVAWVGGSMGGTMGAVIVSADPRLQTAVLNVPGAGWTHMVPYSLLYNAGMGSIMRETYGNELDLHLALVMSQGSWDDVDGAVWADEALEAGGAFLMQESIGDPVLPNLGTDLLAHALGAVQLDPALEDVIGLDHTTGVAHSGATLTQFKVPNTGQYDVHGFAARSTPAGAAAMGQILEFLDTAWAGQPVMRFPDGCAATADGSCDFSGMWD